MISPHKHRFSIVWVKIFQETFISLTNNKSLTFVASTSVAICDESPLLQSIGPTVIKKRILEFNKQRRVEIKLPFISSPQAVRADPTSMSHPSMDET
jgi:hypothetical protein